MTVNEVYEYFGKNWANLIREGKFGVNAYRRWIKNKTIPLASQRRIEVLTHGDLQADLPYLTHIKKTKRKKKDE